MMKSLFTGKMPTAFTLATCIGAVTAQPAAAAAVTPPGALQSCQAHLGWVPLEEAHLETFRPYAVPGADWTDEAVRQLRRLHGA